MNAPLLQLRAATSDDAPALCRLMGQLGYPAAEADFAPRLIGVLLDLAHAVLVVEHDRAVIGLAHVARIPALDATASAELFALVVDETHRGRGAGAQLLAAAEEWTGAAGCTRLVVRSNVVRTRTHVFYEQRGYARPKTQHMFSKTLGPAAAT